ncbi:MULTISPECIES: hypothetical protein [unclassified Frondihabitans]|uniref:hypothetical protein n=1 Tax=unclassified Frondihabitans TaxID=2626248 RepID=UPI000F4EB232|nr:MULTISPECIES: hypothetical protein [unclassified Frondihabitans]RPE76295.1 hypothetical protein EDF37_2116 [Frondihabitans sp. PhB153]RPF05429.1 hypothetical protein EDF39_2132 [Frondihabitans sp. PhB161]
MEAWEIADAQLAVTVCKALNKPLPGWIAELAKVELNNIPECTMREFRLSVHDTVPKYADIVYWRRVPWWKVWKRCQFEDRPPERLTRKKRKAALEQAAAEHDNAEPG